MTRYAVTIIAIGSIILAGTCRLSAEPTELTVLTYNTHLFRGVNPVIGDRMPQYEDETRRQYIAGEVAASGADIVALQEVWGHPWQQWFAQTLNGVYPHAAYEYSGCDTYVPTGLDSLSNGVLLLSKWPLSSPKFERFPTFFPSCAIVEVEAHPECENWANKGVLTATANVGGTPVRIGISHALLGPSDEKSKWGTDYVAPATTTFQLNGQSYIFALDQHNQAHISRFEDYGRWWDEKEHKYNSGAGWKHLYAGTWGSAYVAVTSFELDGHPYLFGLNKNNQGHITRINDDPATGWTHLHWGTWGSEYEALQTFEMEGQP
ncbi:MAG: endonuclease/exonuclease/phosphatase family protein [Phycisphaerales bacterium]|nr:MAG: endonuclease/exonuclease/phosphatase family protein [Phycisphaerales bacterium]